MNNTEVNSLKTGQLSRHSIYGLICAIRIRETALCSLEGPLESNYSKETTKKEEKFMAKKHE